MNVLQLDKMETIDDLSEEGGAAKQDCHQFTDTCVNSVPWTSQQYRPDDLGAKQRQQLKLHIQKRRQQNYQYLCQHPELRAIIGEFVERTLKERPVNLAQFAAKHFSERNKPVQRTTAEYEDENGPRINSEIEDKRSDLANHLQDSLYGDMSRLEYEWTELCRKLAEIDKSRD